MSATSMCRRGFICALSAGSVDLFERTGQRGRQRSDRVRTTIDLLANVHSLEVHQDDGRHDDLL